MEFLGFKATHIIRLKTQIITLYQTDGHTSLLLYPIATVVVITFLTKPQHNDDFLNQSQHDYDFLRESEHNDDFLNQSQHTDGVLNQSQHAW